MGDALEVLGTRPIGRCAACFHIHGDGACPHCGYRPGATLNTQLLPPGTELTGQYWLGHVLGRPGGSGITYLAWDRVLEKRFAIKEFFPRDHVARARDGRVAPVSDEDAGRFQLGLRQFLEEARAQGRLQHPNLVPALHLFRANGTAYLVMPYHDGMTLNEYLASHNGRLPEGEALELLLPILYGLAVVHGNGLLHRDIKPRNIYLTDHGVPMLLDFSAARAGPAAGGDRSLSVVLTPGYAPFEQYHRHGNQGPWSDVYACSAVLYRMVTGVVPPEASERIAHDGLVDPARLGVSPALAAALRAGLAMQPQARPQSIQDFVARLPRASDGPVVRGGLPRLRATARMLRRLQRPRWAGDQRGALWLLSLGLASYLGLLAGGAAVIVEERKALAIDAARVQSELAQARARQAVAAAIVATEPLRAGLLERQRRGQAWPVTPGAARDGLEAPVQAVPSADTAETALVAIALEQPRLILYFQFASAERRASLEFVLVDTGERLRWQCLGGSLPGSARPPRCRNAPTGAMGRLASAAEGARLAD